MRSAPEHPHSAKGPTGRRRAIGVLVACAYSAALAATAPKWPDDWDGVGFVEAVTDFDMAGFRPHPPGYPVYVALLRLARVVVRSPMAACVIVAAGAGAATAAFLWSACRRRVGARAALAVVVLVAIAPSSWRACSGVGSEAPALAFAAMCAWALVAAHDGLRAGPIVLGVGAGLGLGVRLSWAPLFVAMLALAPTGARRRAWLACVASTASWALPFAGVVGPARIVHLYSAHLAGHASRWGGTIATAPGPLRLAWLARDVFVDGLGAGADPAGIGVAAFALAAAGCAVHDRAKCCGSGIRAAAVVLAPYAVWIALGQNIRDEPRHALPIVVAIAAALGSCAGRSRLCGAAVGALTVCMAIRTGLDVRARTTTAPPGAQLVAALRAETGPDRPLVFGTRSVRFFETTDLAGRAFAADTFGEVELELARVDSPPSRVWITSEVSGLAESGRRLPRVLTLCRPPRIDRRRPCLDVYQWIVRAR